MMTNRKFLGTGWAFPVDADEAGGVALATGEASVEQSIRLILGTAKGERVMRPEFGCGVHDYVFETFGSATATLAESAVEEALRRWEPRVDVTDVTATFGGTDGATLTVEIAYRVRSTNTEFNLVYPFYLRER